MKQFIYKKFLNKKILYLSLLFLTSFLIGHFAARFAEHHISKTIPISSEGSWGLSFQEEGKSPVANATFEELKKYDAYYAEDTDEKVLYLTFDAGFENGNTPAILDALRKHQVPATFFVVGNYLSTSPDLVKRMVSEGHIVGNHTFHHPDMSKMSTFESFSKEIQDVEQSYRNYRKRNDQILPPATRKI